MPGIAIKIHDKDNVAIALTSASEGEIMVVGDLKIRTSSAVNAKHKFALNDIPEGGTILMYGIPVGQADFFIRQGEVITQENVTHLTAGIEGRSGDHSWNPPDVSHFTSRVFMGYKRSDGQVGTRNIWLFIPLVFCENRNIEILRETFESELNPQPVSESRRTLRKLINRSESIEQPRTRVFGNLELRFLMHDGGCGGTRDDSTSLARLFAGYLTNPNVAGATVLSLGCQNLQVETFTEALKEVSPAFDKPLVLVEQQKAGTTQQMLNDIIRETYTHLQHVNKIPREPAPLSLLKIGLECGGSDGFSGISANPALGHVSDMITALGGGAILAEFPELCGVEQQLIERCTTPELADKFMSLMEAYQSAAEAVGSGFDMNPSPGNIRDGLVTDAMKSAGAARKGGNSPVTDVLDYGEYARKAGLNLLCTPGNDVESTTALAGSGANLIVFTTGLGTPTGNAVVPVLKVSSNSSLAERMPDIIDFDTGRIIQGTATIREMGEAMLEEIIAVASGEKLTSSEVHRQYDFIPWKRGVSL